MRISTGSGTDMTEDKYAIADKRDWIIFGEPYDKERYPGGCRRFDGLTIDQIDQLDELGIIDHNECQNDSPSIGEIIEFIQGMNSDGWYVHGYCVCAERSDFRITFEGVGKKTAPTMKEMIKFVKMFRDADDFEMDEDGMYCWYD